MDSGREHVDRSASADSGSLSRDAFLGALTQMVRLLKSSMSSVAGSLSDDLFLGAERMTERLFLSLSWFMSHVTSDRPVLRDIERAREVASESAGDEGRTFDD